MSGSSTDEDEESPLVRSAREIIRSAVTALYRVPPEEAAGLERELLLWFDRFRRRPGGPSSIPLLRSSLISMACRVAHIYWMGRLADSAPSDERIERTLALGPDIVALELEARIARLTEKKRS